MARAVRPGCRSCWAWQPGPRPKWCCQTRLTSTRAVSGFLGLAMRCASSSRPLPWANGFLSPPRTVRNRLGDLGSGRGRIAADQDRRMFGGAASPSVWMTGNWGGSLFLQAGELRPQAGELLSGFVGKLGFDLLHCCRNLEFQAVGFPLQERVDLLILGLDRGLGGLVGVEPSLGHGGPSTYSVLAKTPSRA